MPSLTTNSYREDIKMETSIEITKDGKVHCDWVKEDAVKGFMEPKGGNSPIIFGEVWGYNF